MRSFRGLLNGGQASQITNELLGRLTECGHFVGVSVSLVCVDGLKCYEVIVTAQPGFSVDVESAKVDDEGHVQYFSVYERVDLDKVVWRYGLEELQCND